MRSTCQRGENGFTGLALAGLQWGPICALAVLGTAIEVAHLVS